MRSAIIKKARLDEKQQQTLMTSKTLCPFKKNLITKSR